MNSRQTLISRLCFIAAITFPCFLRAADLSPSTTQPTPPPLVGVIRWDGQSGGFKPGEVGSEEERALGPEKWHGRLPFWATTPTPNSCTLNGETPEVMDREIAYAKEAGINYWAFCWYADDFYLSHGRHLYLASKHANDVKYCLIIGKAFSDQETRQLVDEMKAPNYQKVLGNRPLLYTLELKNPKVVAALRERCALEHVPDPFVVIMGWHGQEAAGRCRRIHGNAIGAYTSIAFGKSVKGNVPYDRFAAAQRAQWNEWMKTGAQVIPWLNVGWDPRPRIEMKPRYLYAPPDTYRPEYSMSTGPQFVFQLQQAIAWVRAHPAACQANSVLCYAWNEFSEGGTICPKLSGNREYLDAVKSVTAGLQSPSPATNP